MKNVTRNTLLTRIERFYDAVPRAGATAEPFGGLTLFVQACHGWPYYARPALDGPAPSLDDVHRARARQRELDVPEAFEWVDEVTPGLAETATDAGPAERDAAVSTHPGLATERENPRSGLVGRAVLSDSSGAVCVGSYQRARDAVEIVGVATLPSARRRGYAVAVTSALTSDALERGASLVLLSAGDENVARVYERLGFRRVGTACIAEPA